MTKESIGEEVMCLLFKIFQCPQQAPPSFHDDWETYILPQGLASLTPIVSADSTHCLQNLLSITISNKQMCYVSNSHYTEYKFHMGIIINHVQNYAPSSRCQKFTHNPATYEMLQPSMKITSIIINNSNTTLYTWTFYASVSKTMRYRALLAATSFVAAFSWDNFITCTKIWLKCLLCHAHFLVEQHFISNLFAYLSLLILESYAEVEQCCI